MTSADFLRENSWLAAALILMIVVFFSLLKKWAAGRRARSSAKFIGRKNPDELPDLTSSIKRAKRVTIILGGTVIGITLWALISGLQLLLE